MGKIMSVIMRPVTRYNIENRAHKVISREKPVRAPQYDSTRKQIEVAQKLNPYFMETHNKKDAELDERLKNVYVQSHDDPHPEVEHDPNRPLPKLTVTGEGFEFGYWEPEHILEGKCSLKEAIALMSDHTEDPVKNSVEAIAAKYKLNPKDVENLLEYYRVYKVIVPEGLHSQAYVDRAQIPAPPPREL